MSDASLAAPVRRRRLFSLLAAGIALTISLGACGSSGIPEDPPTADDAATPTDGARPEDTDDQGFTSGARCDEPARALLLVRSEDTSVALCRGPQPGDIDYAVVVAPRVDEGTLRGTEVNFTGETIQFVTPDDVLWDVSHQVITAVGRQSLISGGDPDLRLHLFVAEYWSTW